MRNKKQFSNYIIMSFIPLVMIPVLIIAIFPYSGTTKKMIEKTKDFYCMNKAKIYALQENNKC